MFTNHQMTLGIQLGQLAEICQRQWFAICVRRQVCEGQKTNHSLQVSGTTGLLAAGVLEWIIQLRTEHSSLNQEITVSKILTSESKEYKPALKSWTTTSTTPDINCSSVSYNKDCFQYMYRLAYGF